MNFYNIIDLKINVKFAIKFNYHLGDKKKKFIKLKKLKFFQIW